MIRLPARRVGAAILAIAFLSTFGPSRHVVPSAGALTLALTCESCIVVSPIGAVYETYPDRELPMASTTKMVTALVARSSLDLDDRVSISRSAAATGGGGVALVAGERYTAKALLEMALMTSSNDAAVALAEAASGTHEAFVSEMNAFATAVGADQTHFVTAHGLDAPGHHSTVRDLVLFGQLVLDDPVLAEIVATQRSTVSGGSGEIVLENRNTLLGSYKGALGIKTGMTLGAGEALVAAAERDGVVVIAAVLRSTDAASDARILLDHAFALLEPVTVVDVGTAIGTLWFPAAGSATVVTGTRARGVPGEGSLRMRFVLSEDHELPLSAAENIGTIEVSRRGVTIAEVPALSADTVAAVENPLASRVVSKLIGAVAWLVGRR